LKPKLALKYLLLHFSVIKDSYFWGLPIRQKFTITQDYLVSTDQTLLVFHSIVNWSQALNTFSVVLCCWCCLWNASIIIWRIVKLTSYDSYWKIIFLLKEKKDSCFGFASIARTKPTKRNLVNELLSWRRFKAKKTNST